MWSRLILIAALCASVLVTPSVALKHENYHTILLERQRLGLSPKPVLTDNVTHHVMVQPLDHFDRYNTVTYNQSYWLNEQFMDLSRPVGFIFLGGEWQEGGVTIEYGLNVVSVWAKQFGALMLDIQHRYYDGQNPPSDDGQPRFLQSAQAIADAARVVKEVNQRYSSRVKQPIKWIVTSGSYGGILAAIFRLKYPELTVGAIAISAPVTATLAYDGFFAVGGLVLNQTEPECFQTVRGAVSQVDKYLDDPKDGWAKINKDFNTNIASALDVQTWAVQAAEFLTTDSMCSMEGSTPYEKVLKVASPLNATYNASTILNPYGMLWAEQLCSEWSFYQTGTDFDTNPLQIASRHATPEVFMQACDDMFGWTPAQVEENIRWTNVQYGGKQFATTNTFFSNGNADSWSAAGITDRVPSFSGNHVAVIDGGFHCSDLYWPSEFDSDSLKAARAAEINAIKEWLSA